MNASNVSSRTQQQSSPIRPEDFWAKFSAALRQNWNPQVEALWWDWTKRTEFMTDVLKKLAPAFGCHCDCEYWPRVDVSYFDHRSDQDWSEWSQEAAIELENDDFWENEVCKLMQINAGIKVLIAYVGSQKTLDDFFQRLPIIYQSRKYVTDPCNWLFVFGLFGKADWDFIAFKFDGQTTTPITGDVRTRPCCIHELPTPGPDCLPK
jgi:hypothetical protein